MLGPDTEASTVSVGDGAAQLVKRLAAIQCFLHIPTQFGRVDRDSEVEVEGNSFALFFSDRWRLTLKTVVDLGIRWDKQTYSDLENATQFSPRFSLVHQAGPNTDIRMSWGLRVEAYQKSLQHQRPRFENLFDPLAIIPELEPGRVRVAVDSALSRGVETSIAYDSDGKFGWWASYTIAESVDRFDGREVPRNWDQRHAMQIGLDWTTGRWEFGMSANVRSGWPRTTLSVEPFAAPAAPSIAFGSRNAERFGSFATIDARAEYTAPFRDGSLSFFVAVTNAADRENPCCIDFDVDLDAQGNPKLEQKYDFWLPLFPSIGVLWEF